MTPLGIDPGTVRLVAQRLNHYATQGPLWRNVQLLFSTLKIGAVSKNISDDTAIRLKVRHLHIHPCESLKPGKFYFRVALSWFQIS